jgi:hypothetical protein
MTGPRAVCASMSLSFNNILELLVTGQGTTNARK